MKKTVLKSSFGALALALILLTSSFSESSTNALSAMKFAEKFHAAFAISAYKELIVKVNEINEKNNGQIRTSIESGGGFVFKGYCPSLKVLMYLVDRDAHPDNSFLDKLTALNFTYEIKDGSTIAEVSAACGVTADGNPATITE